MLIIPAIIESYRSLKDRTYKIMFETSELSPAELGELGNNLQQFGYLAFKNEPFKKEEQEIIESLKSDFDDDTKSPSQRLRNVLFRLWEKKPEGYDNFNLYYKFKYEKLIIHFKKILHDLS
jgi:hypothetical protein